MVRYSRLFGLLILVAMSTLPLSRCAAQHGCCDTRGQLLASFKHGDKDFAENTDSYKLTHFSYVGTLMTTSGRVYVCDARWVLHGMRAPRGVSCIVFCNRHLKYLGKILYYDTRPLQCEKGKVYLSGDIVVPPDPGWSNAPSLPEAHRQGNVVDVSQGFQAIRIYHTKVYGSSNL